MGYLKVLLLSLFFSLYFTFIFPFAKLCAAMEFIYSAACMMLISKLLSYPN